MAPADLRLAALERLVLAIAPWLSDQALVDATSLLRADLVAAKTHQERIAIKQALLLLANGAARLDRAAPGAWLEAVLHGSAAPDAPKHGPDFP
jgi:hypothetical protein